MMVGLWVVHSFRTAVVSTSDAESWWYQDLLFPRKISRQTQNWQRHKLCPEHQTRKQSRNNALILRREPQFRRHSRIDSNKDQPDNKTSRYCNDMVLRPYIGDQSCFPQDCHEDSCIERCTPYPMSCSLAITLRQITKPDKFGCDVQDQRVVKSVADP